MSVAKSSYRHFTSRFLWNSDISYRDEKNNTHLNDSVCFKLKWIEFYVKKKQQQNLPCKSMWCETAGVDQRQTNTKTICLLSFNIALLCFSLGRFIFRIILLFFSFNSIHQLHSIHFTIKIHMKWIKTMKIYWSGRMLEDSFLFASFWYDLKKFTVRYLKQQW